MKKIEIETTHVNKVVMVPDNCNHPQINPRPKCEAINHNNPECDCRWCVFNREYSQADTNPCVD
jgi:hypothetical protein